MGTLLDVNKEETELVGELDNEIIEFLFDDENFKISLEAAINSSKELLTSQPLLIDRREVGATANNWLKDFFKAMRGEDFNLNLTAYLTKSESFKKLNEEEKRIINNLFKLYYNLHYWPESVSDLPVETWQIIPYPLAEEELTKTIHRPLEIPTIAEGKPAAGIVEKEIKPVIRRPQPL